jgi:predicted kinase
MDAMKDIEDLLERYFEGLTSAEEEKMLRHFFTFGEVPRKLIMYTPLFAYFDAEAKKATTGDPVANERYQPDKALRRLHAKPSDNRRKPGWWWISGAVACAAVLAGLFFFSPPAKKCAGSGNYVIIDGRCYTDATTVRAAALKTLREISSDDSDIFPENDKNGQNEHAPENASGGTAGIIRKQLNEFNSFFDEGE